MIGGFVAFGDDNESLKATNNGEVKCTICEEVVTGKLNYNPCPLMSSNRICCKICYEKLVEPTRIHRFFQTES